MTSPSFAGKMWMMNLDRRLLAYSKKIAGLLGAAVAGGFLAGLATVGQSLVLTRIIGGVFLKGWNLADSTGWLWLLLGLVLARAALGWAAETSAGAAAARVKDQVRERLLHHVAALGPAFSEEERSGEVANTVVQGVEALDGYFSQYLPQLALAGLLPLAYLAVIIPIDPLSGLALLLTGPLIPLFMVLIGSASQKLTGRQWAALGQMSAYFLDTLQGLAVLKSLGRSREQTERIARVSERYRETTLSVMRLTFLSALALELLSTIGTAVVAVQMGLRLLYGRVEFEAAFFVLLMAPEFYLPLRNLGLRFHASMSGLSAAKRIFAVLDVPPASPSGSACKVDLRQPFEIQLEDVTYQYSARQEEASGEGEPGEAALRGVSLTIRSGQMLALVGASGSGKSTVSRLLLRFLEPQGGSIRVNGIPLAEIERRGWLSQIAWVPQMPYLFHDSLSANLRLGCPTAGIDDLRRAAEAVHLAEWIEGLPQGYDTPVGEGGARLSGGQAQRLALARAFLRDASLLVLDEPTAHLDVEQEALLQAALERICAGRTVLVIAHRLGTAARADVVAVLEAGRVVEAGSPVHLAQASGAYARLLRASRGEV